MQSSVESSSSQSPYWADISFDGFFRPSPALSFRRGGMASLMNTVCCLLPVIILAGVTASLPSQGHGVHPKQHGKLRVLIVDGFSNHAWQQNTFLLRVILASAGEFTVDVATM